jgi:hypothetical protein
MISLILAWNADIASLASVRNATRKLIQEFYALMVINNTKI